MKKCIRVGCNNPLYSKKLCREHNRWNKLNMVYGENRTENPLYKCYHAMLGRCYNQNNKFYNYYGGRGITVCEEWKGLNGFSQFLKDMGKRPKDKTLDRTDNSKGYSADNCRWATRSQQQNNQRTPVTNTSGYKGVSLYKANGKWTAYINVKHKKRHLGYFDTIEGAIAARKKVE